MAPADAACVPDGQRSQLAPIKYRPAGQTLQSLALVAPAPLVLVPLAHLAHVLQMQERP